MRSFLITTIIVAWVAAIGGIIFTLSTIPNNPATQRGGPTPWVIPVCFFAAIITTAIIIAQLDRLRRRDLAAGLEARGYILNTADGSPAEVLHYRPHKRHHSYRVFFSAVGLFNDRPAHIAEYSYAMGHGKGRHDFRIIEVALDFIPPNPTAPIAIIPRTTFFNRSITKLFDAPPTPPISDEVFNKRWDVDTPDPAAAAEFLHMRRAVMLSVALRPERQWVAADGWLSCSWQKRPTIADIDAMLTRTEMVANA